MTRNEKIRRYGGVPYDGLLGDSNIISILEEVIADPTMEYHPIDLVGLTGETSPTVRKSLKALTSAGLLLKDRTDPRHPVYRVNTKSKKYLALNLLAYAVLDDKLGTDRVDRIIANYCDTVLREKYANDFALNYLSEHIQTEKPLMEEYMPQREQIIDLREAALPQNDRYKFASVAPEKCEANLQEPLAAAV